VLTTAARPESAARSETRGDVEPRPVGAFLTDYVATVLPLLAALAVLWTGWAVGSGHGWLVAGGATAGWVLLVVAWLNRRGWSAGVVHPVAWVVPAAVVGISAASGGLSPGSLVLAGPLTSVLAVAVVTSLGPLPQRTCDSWSR
jgi:hypothetical protein